MSLCKLRCALHCSHQFDAGVTPLVIKILLAEMEQIVKTFKHHGLCSEIHYKEMYIPQEELEGAMHAPATKPPIPPIPPVRPFSGI